MATTTNYGWTTPNDTDLVKNGASAIRTLGSAVDTSLFNITNGKNVGLVPIATTSFTAQTNIDILNCFSSTYDNYLIETLVYNTGTTGDYFFNIQFLDGSTPITANYANAQFYMNTSGASGVWGGNTSANVINATQFGTSGYISTASLEVHNPNKTTFTTVDIKAYGKYGSSAAVALYGGGAHYANTAFSGIRFLAGGTNTATGIIRVYGLRNS